MFNSIADIVTARFPLLNVWLRFESITDMAVWEMANRSKTTNEKKK
jgi:hypothetical protein